MSIPGIKITGLRPDDEPAINQAAALLVEGFREHSPRTWPDTEAALREVRESLRPDRLNRTSIWLNESAGQNNQLRNAFFPLS